MGETMRKCKKCGRLIPLGGICLDCETEVCPDCDGAGDYTVAGEVEICCLCGGRGVVTVAISEETADE